MRFLLWPSGGTGWDASPATVIDADGKKHTLRYVRILVTANRVEES